MAAREEARRRNAGPEDRDVDERCILGFNSGPPMLPGAYNNFVQLFQIPGHVAILNEMVHDVRLVPMDNRPSLSSNIRQWMGNSRGRWDGDTLVIETEGVSGMTWFARSGSFHSDGLRVVARMSARTAETLNYEVSIEDPEIFTRPWTMHMPLYRRVEVNSELMEFRCVEFVEDLIYGHLRKQPD